MMISQRQPLIFWLLAALCFIAIFLNICIIDDAYISFRVVDNAVHGWGLRWNVDERVQAYTNPLWLLLHIPLYALIGNIYWTTILLSLIFGVLTVACLLAIAQPASRNEQIVLVLLPLIISRIFRNYVVCGLENPLSFFLFVAILWELFTPRPRFYRFCFLLSLAVFTRFDNLFLLLPVSIVLFWQHRKGLHFGRLLLAVSPALAWYGFSLFYYGFFFPNTKYAKLHMGITVWQSIHQGLVYLANFPKTDLPACLITLAAWIYMLRQLPTAWRARFDLHHKASLLSLLAAGFAIHTAYVIWAGGDFMPGRFFANMFIVALAVLGYALAGRDTRFYKRLLYALLFIAAVDQLLWQPLLPDRKVESLNGGIDDQHDYYWPVSGMLSDPDHWLRLEPDYIATRVMKARREMVGNTFFITPSAVSGMKFYYGGPYIMIIDRVGIADVLLARLPTGDTAHWRIGHPIRDVPQGYAHARETGDISQMDASLGAYYQKLRLVVMDDLFSRERLWAILGFQLGSYDYLLGEYAYRQNMPYMKLSY